jgi:hypothetical protein
MAGNHSLRLLLILIFAALACGLLPASPSPDPAPPIQTDLPPAAVPPPLTLEQINNVPYPLLVPNDGRVVRMSGGKFQQGADATDPNFVYVAVTQFAAFGDLTGDGAGDAAVIFLENYGGTGNFGVLAVYANVTGEPVFLHSTLIDDRPMINRIAVENGEVFLDAIVHDFDDGGCCPTLPTTRRYVLENNRLRLTHYTTDTPTGARRAIEITLPANGAEASGSVQVTGVVTIAPFENNLSYAIYDENGNPLAGGAVMVAAPDFGAPGTFDETISLAGIPAGATVFLEIQDLSAADGSLLALDVVKLLVR